MDKLEQEMLLEAAHSMGIEVTFAFRESDVEREGMHLVEPTFEQLMDGIARAMVCGVKLVLIHSRLNYPYKPKALPSGDAKNGVILRKKYANIGN